MMTRPLSTLVILTSLCSLAPALAAAETATSNRPMENVVVTGTRLQNSISTMPTHVTVIDRATIDASQARTVLDLLRGVAGIHITQYGGRGGVSSLFVRGAESNFTVILIDGVKVNDPNDTRGGSFDFATLNLAEVQRIEIVRGAQSAVYGSDGLAGIINIITRTGSKRPRTTLEAEAAENGFLRGSVYTSGPIGDTATYALTAGSANDGHAIPGNAFDDTNFDARLHLAPGQDLTMDLSGRYASSRSESFPEDSGGPRLAVIRDVDRRDQTQSSLAGALTYAVSDRTSVHLHVDYVEHKADTSSPGVVPGVRQGVPPNSSDSTLERSDVGTNVVFNVSDSIATTVGLDYQKEQGDLRGTLEVAPGVSFPTDFSLERDLLGVFGEMHVGGSSGPSLSFALRKDKPSDRSSRTSARAGAQYQFATTRVFGTWSQGYKLPSFFALGHPLVGNPNLRPETSTNAEIGIDQTALADRLTLTLAAFDNKYKDLIDFDPNLFLTVNRSEVTIRGAELSIVMRAFDELRVSGHVTNTHIHVSDNTVLRQRPSWRGGIAGEWDVSDKFNIAANWNYVGDSFDSSIPTGGETLPGYNRLDLEFGWNPLARLKLWFAVDNVFDRQYEEAIGFPGLGRRVRAGVRFNLQP